MGLIREINKDKYRKYYADYNAYVTVIKADTIAASDYGISPIGVYDFFEWFDAGNELDCASDTLVERFAKKFFHSYEYETVEDCRRLVSKRLIAFTAKERNHVVFAGKAFNIGDTIDSDVIGFLVTYNDVLENDASAFEAMAKDTYANRAPNERDVPLCVARKMAAVESYEEKVKILANAYFSDWESYYNARLYTFVAFVNEEPLYVGTKEDHQFYYYPEDALEAGIIYFEQCINHLTT